MTYNEFIYEFHTTQIDSLCELYANRFDKLKEFVASESVDNENAYDIYNKEYQALCEATSNSFKGMVSAIKKTIGDIDKKIDNLKLAAGQVIWSNVDWNAGSKACEILMKLAHTDPLTRIREEMEKQQKKFKDKMNAKIEDDLKKLSDGIGATMFADVAIANDEIKKMTWGEQAKLVVDNAKTAVKHDDVINVLKYKYMVNKYKSEVTKIKKKSADIVTALEAKIEKLETKRGSISPKEYMLSSKYYNEIFKSVKTIFKLCLEALPNGKILSRDDAANIYGKIKKENDKHWHL